MTELTPAHILLGITAITFGLYVFLASLFSASRTGTFQPVKASCRSFYVSTTILPDHVFYPTLAAADRLILILAPEQEKIRLQVDYGQLRLEYAKKLVEKDNLPLALSTLTKSQKYFNLAAHKAAETELDFSTKRYLTTEMKDNIQQAEQLNMEFEDSQRVVVDQLNQQNEALLEALVNKSN